jgi:Fe-S cluster biogenesis protein NfuA
MSRAGAVYWTSAGGHRDTRAISAATAPLRRTSEDPVISRERVQAVIDRIRPLIQGDGGDIELIDVVENNATVRLTGNCVGCPSAQMTLFMGVEMAIKEEIPEFEELQVV